MKKAILYLVLFQLITLTLYAQIGSKAKQGNSLIGTWQSNDNGFANLLILNTNGTGEFNGDALTYKVQGSSLVISMDATTTNYTFMQNGIHLTLSGGDLSAPMIFTKSGTTENTPQNSTKAQSSGNEKKSLIGTWNGSNEVLVFNNDGTMNLNGYQLQYSVIGNNITIQTNNGTVNYTYELNGNNLTVNMNGQTALYTRGEVVNNAASNNVQNNSVTSQLKGRIAMELVGKWCWVNVNSTNSGGSSSSQCIVINADGTYSYSGESSMSANSSYGYAGTASQSSDQGTWRLDGNSLNVMSQSQGFKTYTLQKMNHPKNNDPMIVIDGQTFVTYYQKAPW